MGEIIYNKLVRDNIPHIIIADGQVPVVRKLDDDAYTTALLRKLDEEVKELIDSDGAITERIDVAEVLKALDEHLGFDAKTVEAERIKKFKARGGFSQRIFLEKAITKDL